MSTASQNKRQKELNDVENCSPGAGQPGGGNRTVSNDKYKRSGQKATDRKTGLEQADDHFSWKEVYAACGVEVWGHE